MDDGGGEPAVFVDGDEIGGVADGESAGSVCEASHGGWVGGEEPESLLQRRAGEADEIGEGAVEGEHAAGQNTTGHGAALGNFDGKSA